MSFRDKSSGIVSTTADVVALKQQFATDFYGSRVRVQRIAAVGRNATFGA